MALDTCGHDNQKDLYSNDRTGNPNAVVNARQKKVNTDYHSRAESLDARGGDTRDGFEAELNSYGQGGRYLGRWSGLLEKCLMT